MRNGISAVGFDWKLFKAQGMAESGLSPTAKSWVGARGIMQLMPSTYHDISSHRPEMTSIDDPQWNIAAGIMHDRDMWTLWKDSVPDDDRWRFMFGGYNAGEGTIFRAQGVARASKLDERTWPNIESIAPTVPRWRYKETLGYVHTIEENRKRLSPIDGAARLCVTLAHERRARALPANRSSREHAPELLPSRSVIVPLAQQPVAQMAVAAGTRVEHRAAPLARRDHL